MIQTWKEVSYSTHTIIRTSLISASERTWSWMEEMAEINWSPIGGFIWLRSRWRVCLVQISHVNGFAWARALSIIRMYLVRTISVNSWELESSSNNELRWLASHPFVTWTRSLDLSLSTEQDHMLSVMTLLNGMPLLVNDVVRFY